MSVVIDDVPVEEWSSARTRSLFGYLLTHRQPWPAREVLMEVFWPESSPKASRNSLNVAIHGLRCVLRKAKDVPVIVYSGGTYRLHPDVRLWLDVEEFDKLVERGRLHEDVGETDQATAAYEFATGLYRGEFLADDPYDDWAALIRERLRLAYLDTLGRLSNLHFNAGRYAASATPVPAHHRTRSLPGGRIPAADALLQQAGSATPGADPVPGMRPRAPE